MLNTSPVTVIVVCEDASGIPELVAYDVNCTKEQYANGDHYDEGTRLAVRDGYNAIFAFDTNDTAGKQLTGKIPLYGSQTRFAQGLPDTIHLAK